MSMEELIARYDKSRMIDLILKSPQEFEKYLEAYKEVEFPREVGGVASLPRTGEWRNVVILGMGGSAIVGDVVHGYLYDKLSIPVEVVRSPQPPRSLGNRTLMVSVSYSGNTVETITATLEGLRRGAYPVIVTSGGMLRKLATRLGAPLYELPPGRPPRTALSPMLAAVLRALEAAGLLKLGHEVESAAESARALVREIRTNLAGSIPARVAKALEGRVPLVYSYQPYTPLGYRLKTQLNENAKYHAFFMELPEGNHNEVMGWEGRVIAKFHAVFIRGHEELPEISVCLEYWREVLREKGVEVSELRSRSQNRLAEYLELMVMVDLTSYILALNLGVDPTPVATISRLKHLLESKLEVSARLERRIERLLRG